MTKIDYEIYAIYYNMYNKCNFMLERLLTS